MKKTFKFFAAALAIVAAASCANEISNDNIQNETPKEDAVDKVFMTFDASIDTEETPDTKTTLNGKLVEWNEDDEITLYGTMSYNTGDGYNKHKGYCVIDPSTISDDKLRASFAGNVAASADYCAFYPGDNWEADGTTDYKYIFSGFATQNAVKGSFDPSKHVMVARKLEDGCFNFKNVCALAKVTIGSEGVYSVKIEGQAWYSGTDYGSIGGPYGWKTSGSLFEYSPVFSNKIHSITLSNENGSELEVGATYYIVLPVCEIKGFTVSICNQSGAVLKSISKSSNFNVERNKIYDLGTFEVPDMVGDFFYSDGSYSSELDKNKTVVGVIFYVGDPTADDTTLKKDYPSCTNGLVLGLNEKKMQLSFSSQWVVPEGYMNVQGCHYGGGVKRLEPQALLMTGYNNTEVMRINRADSPSLEYCREFPKISNGSIWYVPTIAEFDEMYKNLAVLNASLSEAGATKLIPSDGASYWTTSEEDNYPNYVANYNMNSGTIYEAMKGYQTNYIRPIFAF